MESETMENWTNNRVFKLIEDIREHRCLLDTIRKSTNRNSYVLIWLPYYSIVIGQFAY